MNDIVEFLTSKEIIVVYIVVAVICFLSFIIYIVSKSYSKRKRKSNTRKLNQLVDDVRLRMQEGIDDGKPKKRQESQIIKENKVETIKEELPVQPIKDEYVVNPSVTLNKNFYNKEVNNLPNSNTNSVPSVKHDVTVKKVEEDLMDKQINNVNNQIEGLIYKDPEPNREEATRELIKLTKELEKAEHAQRENKIDITAYEASQEENAIISLDELNRKSKELYASNEVTQYMDEGDEPISLKDLEKRKASVVNLESSNQVEKLDEVKPVSNVSYNNAYNSNNAYHGSLKQPMISPVYGVERNDEEEYDENVKYDIDEEELAKTSEFLISLKDLQNRLDS